MMGGPITKTDEIVTHWKLRSDQWLRISDSAEKMSDNWRTSIYTIGTEKIGYHKFCKRWVPKMIIDQHKKRRMCSKRAFLNCYRKYWQDLRSVTTISALTHMIFFFTTIWKIHLRCQTPTNDISAQSHSFASMFIKNTTNYSSWAQRGGEVNHCSYWEIPQRRTSTLQIVCKTKLADSNWPHHILAGFDWRTCWDVYSIFRWG